MSLVEKIDTVVAGLRELADELTGLATAGEPAGAEGTSSSEAPADAPADAPAESVDAEQVRVAAEGGYDNTLPFKCPACGKTYAEQLVCMNGHAPEATLPTPDVLDGAAMSDPATPTEPQANQAVVETATTPPPADPPPPAAGA